MAEITEILLSSIATTATTTSVAITGIGLPYSIPTAFATATFCGSLSKAINTKIRNKVIKYSQMYILSKQFSDKFNKLYTTKLYIKQEVSSIGYLLKKCFPFIIAKVYIILFT